MYIRREIIVLVATLILSACQTTAPEPATIPSSTEIVEPSSSVPSDYAAFSGIWSGTWDGMLDSKLAVKKVDPSGDVVAVYAWGDHRQWQLDAGSVSKEGRIEDNVLTLERFDNGAVAKFKLREDGTLDGSYVRKGDITKGVFTKE